jgi:wee1-like protein kinase
MLADCSPKGLECTEFSFYQHITPAQFGNPIQDDLEEDQQMQPVLQKRIGYVSNSALALRCRVTPPPCIKKQYLNMDPIIDDVYDRRQCRSGLCYPLCSIYTCTFP